MHSLFVNGTPIPTKSIVTNFSDDNQYAQAYGSISSATGILRSCQWNLISTEWLGVFILAGLT